MNEEISADDQMYADRLNHEMIDIIDAFAIQMTYRVFFFIMFSFWAHLLPYDDTHTKWLI